MSFTNGQMIQAIGPAQTQSITASALGTLLNGLSSPAAHATTHKSGGTDPIKLDELAAPTDITTLNVSTSAHGLCPKAPNSTSQVLRGDGSFGLPVPFTGDSGAGGAVGAVPAPAAGDAAASKFLKADGTWAAAGAGTVTSVTGTAPIVSSGGTTPAISISDATATVRGAVPTPPNDATKFFNGTAAFSVPVIANLSGSVQASQMPALTGDVTTSAGAVATTIATNAVTNAKAAQMAANTIKGNNTAGTANAADLTVAQTKTLLAITSSDVSGLAASATTDTTNATNIASGTLAQSRFPSITNHGIIIGTGSAGAPTTLVSSTSGTILNAQSTIADPIYTCNPQLGVASSVTGSIKFWTAANGGVTIQPANTSAANQTITIPNTTGTLITSADSQTVTSAMLAASALAQILMRICRGA